MSLMLLAKFAAHLSVSHNKSGVPNLGTCIPRDTFKVSNRKGRYILHIYIYIIYFRIFIHISVNIIFKNHYMLIVKYINLET